MKKKTKTTLVTLAATVVILIGNNILGNSGDESLLDSNSQDIVVQNSKTQSSVTKSSSSQNNSDQFKKTKFPEALIKTQKQGIVPFGYITTSVTKVIDGDTFHIKYDNEDYKVRMLDIDTPESVKSGVDQQPYAEKSSSLTKETLTGKQVKLLFEKGTKDQFGRLLAHVILEDGTYYNGLMVENGYAIAVFYSPNILLRDYFSELQLKAIENKRGFWELPENKRPFVEDSKGKFVPTYKLEVKAA